MSNSKPVIYFDSIKDEFYPNGCWVCGHKDRQGDKGIAETVKDAYID